MSRPKQGDPTELCGGLVGYWPLRGDGQDRSGCGNHAQACGRSGHMEVPASASLDFGKGDFTLSGWVRTDRDAAGVVGDILSQYDPAGRRGLNLSIKASSGGYSAQGDDDHVYFGIDDAAEPSWEDCGRPSPTSNYVSNSLTVFDGGLYCAITDALEETDWCHVFRYEGAQAWEDCGRLGDRRTHGVGPMVVHQGHLYGATWTYDWTRVGLEEPLDDFCCVYRYEGGTSWEDCGQPGRCRRLFGLASYKGRLYVTAEDGACYVYAGDRAWEACGRFPNYAHPMGRHAGKLYAGVLNPAGVWAYDGEEWKPLGNPQGSQEVCDQVHAMEVYRGQLHVTTWPQGHVMRLEPDESWGDCGRLGDAMEINALTVYNGKLYGGSIPRAEVFRYDGSTSWKSVGRFLDPPGCEFSESKEWARVTSLTVYNGGLLASMGSCTSSRLDAPCDFRGKVYAMEAGPCVSYDRDLGAGWKHLAAVRRADRLELFVDGARACESRPFWAQAFDLTNGTRRPLRIGAGEMAYFRGEIREVRAHRVALTAGEIRALASGQEHLRDG